MRTVLLTWYHDSSGESNGMDGQCHHNIPFKEALALCVNAGARLCTLDELLGDETSSTVSTTMLLADLGCIVPRVPAIYRYVADRDAA